MDGAPAAANNTSFFVSSILPIITALLGGLSVAVFTYFITKKKTMAEVKKTNAEVKKLEAEAEEIRLRITSVSNFTGTLGFAASNTKEQVIYDSTKESIGYGFPNGQGEYIWKRIDGKDVSVSGKGEGSLKIEDEGKILTIKRDNTDGRFETWLTQYNYGGIATKYIPREPNITRRVFRLRFDARAVDAKFKLRFIFKNEETDTWPAVADLEITEENWSQFELYFPLAPTEKCRLRIDNVEVSKVPSYFQLRNIILVEKID